MNRTIHSYIHKYKVNQFENQTEYNYKNIKYIYTHHYTNRFTVNNMTNDLEIFLNSDQKIKIDYYYDVNIASIIMKHMDFQDIEIIKEALCFGISIFKEHGNLISGETGIWDYKTHTEKFYIKDFFKYNTTIWNYYNPSESKYSCCIC